MRSYSKIERFLWRDTRFRDLHEDAQKLWLYLLTSPQSLSCPGLFVAPTLTMIDDLAWLNEGKDEDMGQAFVKANARLEQALNKLKQIGWVEYDPRTRVVFVPSAPRHNMPESINVVVSWAIALQSIPACDARSRWIAVAIQTLENNGKTSLAEAFCRALAKTSVSLSEALIKANVSLNEALIESNGSIGEACSDQEISLSEDKALGFANQEQEQEQEQKEHVRFRADEVHLPSICGSSQQAPLPTLERSTPYHEHAEPLAEYLLQRIIEEKPDTRRPSPSAFTRWVRDMHRILVLDKRECTRVREVIDWATRDDFWAANIRSPEKLRMQFDKLELQMRRGHKSMPPRVIDEHNHGRALPYYEDVDAKMRRAGFVGEDQ